ncbi:Heterogeneous nuclear ribonucleoprotein 27C [Nymphon striatum]|nr:Heterogeneous nuclear ribonucleoprotein 27C [Nymphon striatum]
MTYETTELEILFGYRKKLKPDAVPTIKTVLSEQTGVPKTRENKDFFVMSNTITKGHRETAVEANTMNHFKITEDTIKILICSFRKIFVGGLSWETDRDSLSNHFSKYGEVVDCVVMKDNGTGKSRGFGFVTFKEPSVVQNILRDTHLLDGRTIDPKPCNPRSVQLQKKASNFKIFLGGLPLDITETDLKNFFGNYGHVTEVTIMYDQEAKRCRGFGFLSFDSEQSVKKACHDHFVHIKGKQVECKLAQVKQTNSGFSMMNSNQNMYMSSSNVAGNWNMNGQISNNGIGNSYQSWGNQTVGSYQGGYQNWNGGYSVQQQYGAPQSYESGHESAHVVYIDSSTVVLRDMIAYFWKLPPLECQKFSLPRQQEKFCQNCNGMANYYGNYMQQSPADVSQTNQGYQTMAGAPQDVGQSQVGGQGGGTHNAQNTGDSNQADCQNSGYQPYSSQSTGPTGVSDQEIGRDGQNTGYHPYRR